MRTCRCVRPILMMSLNASALTWRASRSSVSAGSNERWISVTAATCMAVGNLYILGERRQGERGRNLRVVAALTHVDMIIGVDWLLGTQFSAQQLDSTIGNDLLW